MDNLSTYEENVGGYVRFSIEMTKSGVNSTSPAKAALYKLNQHISRKIAQQVDITKPH